MFVHPIIALFTDYGLRDPYVGQVKAVLAQHAPGVSVVDLLHEVPAYDVAAGAHLLDALAQTFPVGTVFLAVVDPGVGTDRQAVVIKADGRWFVGPDNGLLSVLAARAQTLACYRIHWQPQGGSVTFAGRDWFAPVCGWLATGRPMDEYLQPIAALTVQLDPDDLARVIYIDHFGNAWTGFRADRVAPEGRLKVGAHILAHARTFAEAEQPFWYCNSVGLIEIAANRASAAQALGLSLGDPVQALPAPHGNPAVT